MTDPAFILDTSVLMAWLLDEGSAYADTVVGSLAEVRAIAPALVRLEVANVLLTAERRRRLTLDDAMERAAVVDALDLDVVDDPHDRLVSGTVALARQHGLTAYDAAFLDLAIRSELPLATLDGDLRRAAASAGVRVYLQP